MKHKELNESTDVSRGNGKEQTNLVGCDHFVITRHLHENVNKESFGENIQNKPIVVAHASESLVRNLLPKVSSELGHMVVQMSRIISDAQLEYFAAICDIVIA